MRAVSSWNRSTWDRWYELLGASDGRSDGAAVGWFGVACTSTEMWKSFVCWLLLSNAALLGCLLSCACVGIICRKRVGCVPRSLLITCRALLARRSSGSCAWLHILIETCCSSVQVIVALAEKGDMSALQAYTGQTGGSLNYLQLLQQLMMNNPSGAVSLAKMVAKQTPPPVDINTMADLFLQV